ncbi:MAG: methyltransferase domain-containing protein [Treponema sp.]|nr:methyltransferase domain-containing protein [Treponema sp.]
MKVIYKIKRKVFKTINLLGKRKKCYICKKSFFIFGKWRGGSKNISEYKKALLGVGSDSNNFSCFYCGCNDRERHLFMYFDKLNIWEKITDAKILHFAPERQLQKRIELLNPLQYIKGDLLKYGKDIQKIDATAIPFPDNTFDIIICNHVLEHVFNYKQALSEIYRVLKDSPGRGICILQTPYSRLLKNNFEDPGINTDELRNIFYGQEDHVRRFGEYTFFRSLEEAGFELNIVKHTGLFSENDAYYFGVNKNEDLIRVTKK